MIDGEKERKKFIVNSIMVIAHNNLITVYQLTVQGKSVIWPLTSPKSKDNVCYKKKNKLSIHIHVHYFDVNR